MAASVRLCDEGRHPPAWARPGFVLGKCSPRGLAWKKHTLPAPLFLFNAALSALFEIAYLSGHELFMRLRRWGREHAEGEEEERSERGRLSAAGGEALPGAARGAEVGFLRLPGVESQRRAFWGWHLVWLCCPLASGRKQGGGSVSETRPRGQGTDQSVWKLVKRRVVSAFSPFGLSASIVVQNEPTDRGLTACFLH